MLVGDDSSAAVLAALEAARGVRHAGAGLVVVLLRESDVAATLHWRVDGTVTTTMAGVAESLGTDRAVLIVVGSVKVAGPLIVACDMVADQLIGAGVVVTARIHVRALTDGGMIWTDLSGEGTHDGSGLPWSARGARAVRSGGRASGPSRFLRRR
ncbi:hypothetical protein [Nocardia amamiensis]|uniref:hypothetical protein n=1 Tax=Nocardia amamiensis TaxID=404578 RepID=UPI00082D3BCF|nr:hypothetical protein [Nocardia amamiensis]